MKKLLTSLFVPQYHVIDEEIIDTQTLYLFRVKLLQTILLTASIVGLSVGVLEILHFLPKDLLYTPILIFYGIINFIVFLLLVRYTYSAYSFAMHFCLFSALATLSVMSMSLVYDEFRFIWFFLLSFASFMLGGKRYGMLITGLILSIVFVQFFTMDLNLSPYAIFTFTASLLTFNAFSLFFLNKIEKDALIMQKHIVQEVKKRETKEKMLQKIQEQNIIHLKDDYLWDSRQKTVTHQGKDIALSQKEQLLLSLLVENKNCCVSFEDIQAHVWVGNYEDEISIQSVKLQITGLRKKLPKGCINNVYGCGYIFHT
jgi:hypothetical protein